MKFVPPGAVRYLYKIHSSHDGFTPQRIPDRLIDKRYLRLGWRRYLDEVEEGDEVWVYFHGRPSYVPGVYAKGIVDSLDRYQTSLLLLVRESSTSSPLTDLETSRRIGKVVAPWYRQVFLVPEEWRTVPACTVASSATSCANHQCDGCGTWRHLPQIDPRTVNRPRRLAARVAAYVPAYWVIPNRSYVYYQPRPITPGVTRTTQMFFRFKVGDKNLAYPLALGIFHRLRKLKQLSFDCIVPIPLSPDKAAAGELHRTRLLAQELSKLLAAPMVELLTLNRPISKRRLRSATGARAVDFEPAYAAALVVDSKASRFSRILLVDDVCTEGSTLRCAAAAISRINSEVAIYAATAGQMVLKAAVADAGQILQTASS